MRIVGRVDGTAAVDVTLPHGEDPARLLWERGYEVQAPVGAARDDAGELVLTVALRPAGGVQPRVRAGGRDRDLVLAPGEVPVPRQRVAAYALVLSDRGLLATELSSRTAVAGAWGLPGGGIDPGEQPVDAVRREVLEETAQTVTVRELLTVQSQHWVGRAPSGTVEDYHALRLIYVGDCPEPTDPRVLDVGGTTASAAWVPREQLGTRRWTVGFREILDAWLLPD